MVALGNCEKEGAGIDGGARHSCGLWWRLGTNGHRLGNCWDYGHGEGDARTITLWWQEVGW